MCVMRTLLAVLLLGAWADGRAEEPAYYLVEALAEQAPEREQRAQASELEAMYARLAQAAGVDATLVYSTDPGINAFATEVGKDKIIVVQAGLLEQLRHDRDAVAATLGHELAHHKADHLGAGRRKQEGVRVLGAILGAVVGARVGREHGDLAGAVTGAAVGAGAGLVALKFSRNQELEADRLSLGWMVQTGYNPQGMLRLQRQLGELAGKGKRPAAILSTHPTSAKRYAAAEKAIAKLAPPADLLAQPEAPLIGSEALARAERSIATEIEAARSAALVPPAPSPAQESLAPIEGMAFADYAALANELLRAGEGGQAAVLRKHKLTQAGLEKLNAAFTERMRADPALGQRYAVEFHRATQGRYAAWGQDLADSYETGRRLQRDPPIPLAQARDLQRALQQRLALGDAGGGLPRFEAETLRPLQLSLYDYLVTQAWWSRHVTLAAMAGDTAPMQALYASEDDDRAQAAEAGVRIGNDVSIGDNVRAGGKALKKDTTRRDD